MTVDTDEAADTAMTPKEIQEAVERLKVPVSRHVLCTQDVTVNAKDLRALLTAYEDRGKVLEEVRQAVEQYRTDLDARKHGGVAGARMIDKITPLFPRTHLNPENPNG